MNPIPAIIGDAQVICAAPIDARHIPTGACKQIVNGVVMGPAAGVAICKYNEDGFYLFGCDSEWQVISDTWHQSIEDAISQAEFEYSGIGKTFIYNDNTAEQGAAVNP